MNRDVHNYYKIVIILILSIIVIIINGNISLASYSAGNVNTTLGTSVSIPIMSTNGLQNFDISISNSGGLNFSSVSTPGISNGGNVSYAGLGSPVTNLATYTFSAPSTPGTYTVIFDVNRTPVTSRVVVSSKDYSTENSSGSSSSSSSNGSTSGTSTTSEESSNANLSNLGIRPNDFSGFKPGTTTYNVTVPEDVESVEVYATAQDSGATISGTGTKTLQNGANALNVVVTAEDGTTKTYTINVTREGEEETEEEQPEENAEEVKNGLSNITIANLELSPSFDTNVYEYTVKYVGEDTSLDIETVATDPNYEVEVLGNEDLKEGENTITILVSDSEGNNVATYQVTVNKTLVDEEVLAREEEEKQKEEQRKMFMIAGGVIALIIIIAIVIIVKRRRNRAYAEEFSGVPFAGMNDEDDYYNDNYEDSNNYYDNYNNDNNIKVKNDLASRENQQNEINLDTEESYDNVKVLDNERATKQIKPQEENLNTKVDNSKENEEKERAKREFLRGYDSVDDDYFEEEKPKRGRKKGKRFK